MGKIGVIEMIQARFISNSREELETLVTRLQSTGVKVTGLKIKRSNNPKYSAENWLCYCDVEITE